MRKEDFEGLKQSVVEAGKVVRGEAAPSRESLQEVTEESPTTKAFAVCVETDDAALLVPRKIYEVEITGGYARVVDEAGEAAVYPAEFFITLNLPAEVKQAITQRS